MKIDWTRLVGLPLYRNEQVKVSSIDEKKRTAKFTYATEGGVRTHWGPEYLRLQGMDLSRYNENPIVLDAHDSSSCRNIVGRSIAHTVDGRILGGEVEYAENAAGQEAWNLVRTGFLRTVSIGFMPLEFKELEDGQTYDEGAHQVRGPCVVIPKSELYELSMVPVPADRDASIRRGYLDMARGSIFARALGDRVVEPQVPPAPVSEDPAVAIRAFTPPGLEALAAELILKKTKPEEAREILRAEFVVRSAPLGTPEPIREEPKTNKPQAKPMDDKNIVRAFRG